MMYLFVGLFVFTWSPLSCLDMLLKVFHWIWEVFSHYFFKYIFLLLSLLSFCGMIFKWPQCF